MGELVQVPGWEAQSRWLPDPTPSIVADIKTAIDRSGLTFDQVAERVNVTCGIRWVRGHLVGRWYEGQDVPLATHARVIWWLGGLDVAATVTQLLTG